MTARGQRQATPWITGREYCAHLQCARPHHAYGLCMRHTTRLFRGQSIAARVEVKATPVHRGRMLVEQIEEIVELQGSVAEWLRRTGYSAGAVERACYRAGRPDLAARAKAAA